mgnify:CR=1 FL=1
MVYYNTNTEKIYLTAAGLEKFKKEHKELRDIRNSESIPKEELIRMHRRMEELELIFKKYEFIKAPPKDRQGIISLGATVVVEINGQIDEFTIVGTLEAEPSKNKISDKSPVGQVLLGKKEGEMVEIKTPIINHKCRIIKINYQNE